MNITICGHFEALKLLEDSPNQLDIILISSPDIDGSGRFRTKQSFLIPDLAREICEIFYHDITFPRERLTLPEKDHVQKALDFSKNRENLIVACEAGISRSSATAYVIQSSLIGENEAIGILNRKIHHPNKLVVSHGADILNKPNMITLIDDWLEDVS